jgi:hypothetical protein
MRFWRSKRRTIQPTLISREEKPSERLVEQRVRNRIMEELSGLSRGGADVIESGPTEWFESFFDWFPYEGEAGPSSAMTPDEASAVREVLVLMQRAASDPKIPKSPTVDEVARSGWPRRVAPVAKRALDLMLQRGRYSEEVEEAEPSNPAPWP